MPSAQRREAAESPGLYPCKLGREHLAPGFIGSGPAGRYSRQPDWVDTVGAERAVLARRDSDGIREPGVWNAGDLGGRPGWAECVATDVIQRPPGRNAGLVPRR